MTKIMSLSETPVHTQRVCTKQGECSVGGIAGSLQIDRTFCSLFIAVTGHSAIPVSRRRPLACDSLESKPVWQREDSEDSRMCDPFCNDPAIPADAAITLVTSCLK